MTFLRIVGSELAPLYGLSEGAASRSFWHPLKMPPSHCASLDSFRRSGTVDVFVLSFQRLTSISVPYMSKLRVLKEIKDLFGTVGSGMGSSVEAMILLIGRD